MERRMRGNSHVRCGVGEKVEIISNPYLSLFFGQNPETVAQIFLESAKQISWNSRLKVVIAIPRGNDGNYIRFKQILEQNSDIFTTG